MLHLTTGLWREKRYEMAWKRFSMEKMIIVVSLLGGLIVAVQDANKLAVADRGAGTADTITIYTSAGKKLNAIKWDTGQLVAMGWAFSDHLLLVFAEGLVRRHGIFGGRSQFSLGLAPGEAVKDARFWPEGLVVRTTGGDFFAVANVLEPCSPQARPHSIIPLGLALSQNVEVYLSAGNSVLAIDSKGAQDMLLQRGPFHHIAVSPSGGFLALLTQGGKLLLVSADFQQKLLEHDLAEKARPSQMVWCGNDYILALYDADLIVVDPHGDSESIFYGGGAYVATEMDGARVFNTHCEFFQKFPSPIQDFFGIGSTSPAALLFDALEQFEHLSPKADELVRIIGDHLEAAVEGCVQRNLLRAASFGKCFLDKYNSDRFVRQLLRVLKAQNHCEVGIPLTLAQLDALGMDNHFLGLKICQYLRLPSDRVVVHWACAKLRASLEDEATITRIILDKVGDRNGFAYHPIAKVAGESGQLQLAIQVGRRVPMLMEMREDGRALDKAIASGDTNLKLSLGDFFRLINPRPMAGCLLEAFYDQQDKLLLKDFYYQDDRRLDLGLLAIRETYAIAAVRHLAGLKDRATEGKFADEQVKLLNHQEHLATKAGQAAIGIPLADTVTLATKVGDHRLASKLHSEFKVSDKKFWWWKLKGHVAANDWEGLEAFARSKKPPIGYLPFYDLCVGAHQPSQAMKYALRCEPALRPVLFLKIQAYREAGQQAFANKDVAFLKKVQSECADNEVRRELDVWIVQLALRWGLPSPLNPPTIKSTALFIMATPLSFKPVVLKSQRRHVRPIELSYLRLPSHAAPHAINPEIRVRWALKCHNLITFSPGVHGDPPANFDPISLLVTKAKGIGLIVGGDGVAAAQP
ncbi:Vacuolar protein sorting-associated protein 16 [Massospora cicadina]|nr:Vacuolar protein sorting-associated protein 16 [Massospora cicadina]